MTYSKQRFFIIIFIVIAFVCTIAAVFLHKENGFMSVCWIGDRVAYGDTAECTYKLVWPKDQMPLRYYSYNLTDVMHQSLEAAVNMWNSEIKTLLFVKAINKSDANLIITTGVVEAKDQGAWTAHFGRDNKLTHAQVTITDIDYPNRMYKIIAHELGHVLGLAHDEARTSLMYPSMGPTTYQLEVVVPSDYDKKILKEAYR